jgi:demethylmenaquinone methyltransferase/2-methoxy-6-polyprenyl-1,4-benzoquinol methylase
MPSPVSRQDSVQALFNRIAPDYDRLNDRLSFGLHWVWKCMTVKWVEPQLGHTCLDLCCGSGDLALLLAEQVGQTGVVYGVDFAVAQLEIAAQKAQAVIPAPSIVWQQGNALNLEFPERYFDGITVGYGLRNVVDISRCLAELYRVLKPRGKAALLDMHRPSQAWLRDLQQWYLQRQVVPTARDLGLTAEYAYIGPSIERFPTGPEQVRLAYEAKFSSAKHYPLVGGMMGVLVLQR